MTFALAPKPNLPQVTVKVKMEVDPVALLQASHSTALLAKVWLYDARV